MTHNAIQRLLLKRFALAAATYGLALLLLWLAPNPELALAGAAFDAAEDAERQKAVDAGHTITVIPEEGLAEWKDASQPVIDAWIKATTDAKGQFSITWPAAGNWRAGATCCKP